MPQIPTYTATAEVQTPGPAAPRYGALAAPGEAAAAGGRAIQQLGATLTRVGEEGGQLAHWYDQQYVADQASDASAQWHDELVARAENAKQTGQYDGFRDQLLSDMDADLQQRVANAPSSTAAAYLTRRFNRLATQITPRASAFEMGAKSGAAEASLAASIDSAAKTAYRDPTLAGDLYGERMADIAGYAASGVLSPQQRQKAEKQLGDSVYGAAVATMLERDPFTTAAALNAGKYDKFLSAPVVEHLKARIDHAQGDAAASRVMAGATPSGGVPSGGSGTGEGHVAPQSERIAFARQYAQSQGLNPDAVVATMAGEGLGKYTGDGGTSFGDFQLHVGGGMGDQALDAGIDIRDPNTWREQTKFAIDQMAANRDKGAAWYAGQWHGAPAWAAQAFAQPTAGSGGQPATGAGAEPPGLADKFAAIDRMNLSPGATLRAKEQVRIQHNAAETDALRQARAEEHAAKLAVAQAQDQVIQDVYSAHPTITAEQVRTDPRFNGDPIARQRMMDLVRNHAAGGQTSTEASHQTAIDLIRRIRLPENERDRITSLDPVYDALTAGQLSKGDFDFVRKEFTALRSPDGEDLAKVKAEFIRRAAPLITRANELTGDKDPEGQAQLFNFERAVDRKVEAYRKAGKDPYDLFDKDKPDFVGRPSFLEPFQTTFQEAVRAKANRTQAVPVWPGLTQAPAPAAAPPAAGAPVATAPIPPPAAPGIVPRQPGESPADYLKRIGAAPPGKAR